MKVQLNITEGPMKGKIFDFEEHDSFLFGRSGDATCCLSNDLFVSRNHFLLEVNPPNIWLKELGSKNGTYVNGKKYDGNNPEVKLNHNDVIKVGQTTLNVQIEYSLKCSECGGKIIFKDSNDFYAFKKDGLCKNCEAKKINKKEEVILQDLHKDEQELWKILEKENKGGKEMADIILDYLEENVFKSKRPVTLPRFPGYEIINKIGEGGMGVIYLAQKKSDNKKYAIKIIKPDMHPTAMEIERFKDRDMRIGNELKHKNIVSNFEADYFDGLYYIVMEYVEGIDAQKLLEQKRNVDIKLTCSIIIQCLDALDYMHNKNVVHRDLKPQNILLYKNKDEYIPKIADFGLAKNLAYSRNLTYDPKEFAGTFHYMPPEQIISFKNFKPVGDIFSIGATLYTMITGRFVRDYPYGADIIGINLEKKYIVPVQKRKPDIPSDLASVINRSIAFETYNRIQSAKEFQQELLKCIN